MVRVKVLPSVRVRGFDLGSDTIASQYLHILSDHDGVKTSHDDDDACDCSSDLSQVRLGNPCMPERHGPAQTLFRPSLMQQHTWIQTREDVIGQLLIH